MNPEPRPSTGYTLVELMVVVALLGILTIVSVPRYFESVKRSRAVQCLANRDAMAKAAYSLVVEKNLAPGNPNPAMEQLVSRGLLAGMPVCLAGGVYYWIDPDVPVEGVPPAGCSVHWVP